MANQRRPPPVPQRSHGTISCYQAGCRDRCCRLVANAYRNSFRRADVTEPLESIDMSWAEHGACKGEDPNLFHPDRGESTAAAKAICAGCPVRSECLEHALHHEQMGIWGGTSEKQRRRLRKAGGIRIARPQAFADVWAGLFAEGDRDDIEQEAV